MKNGLEIDKFGNKYWYKNDLLHRKDGPAIEYADGEKYWWINGKLHREDGPAIEGLESPNMSEWWFNNIKINCETNEEFLRLIKLKAYF